MVFTGYECNTLTVDTASKSWLEGPDYSKDQGMVWLDPSLCLEDCHQLSLQVSSDVYLISDIHLVSMGCSIPRYSKTRGKSSYQG